MNKSRRILLSVAGTLNLIMFVVMSICLGLIIGGNEQFINEILKELATTLEQVQVTDGVTFVRDVLIFVVVTYAAISAICFVFAFLKNEHFKKFKFVLFFALILHFVTASFVSMVLVTLAIFAPDVQVEPKAEQVKNNMQNIPNLQNTKMNVLAREIEAIKIKKEKGEITEEQFNASMAEILEKYAVKELDDGTK